MLLTVMSDPSRIGKVSASLQGSPGAVLVGAAPISRYFSCGGIRGRFHAFHPESEKLSFLASGVDAFSTSIVN